MTLQTASWAPGSGTESRTNNVERTARRGSSAEGSELKSTAYHCTQPAPSSPAFHRRTVSLAVSAAMDRICWWLPRWPWTKSSGTAGRRERNTAAAPASAQQTSPWRQDGGELQYCRVPGKAKVWLTRRACVQRRVPVCPCNELVAGPRRCQL
jgi:hypothetical protein